MEKPICLEIFSGVVDQREVQMAKLNGKPVTCEDISESLRHFRKIVLEGKNPTNNLQLVDINLIALKLKSLRKHSKK